MCRKGKFLLSAAALLLAGGGILGGVSALLPQPVAAGAAPAADSRDDYRRTIEAMKPPKRARPVVAVLGDNRGTEAIDFLVPYGVLKESGAAEVFAVAMAEGPLKLRPALTVRAHLTAAQLDALHPEGADYVIVPAMFDHEAPELLAWLRAQAKKGATIVGICAGAEIMAHAGLLSGRSATTHWASVETMLEADPTIRWVPHRRYVADRGVVTTTGVSAALPLSLALVEAISGRSEAGAVAARLGVTDWSRGHDSSGYGLGRAFWTGLGNKMVEWGVEDLGLPVGQGVDDIALALTADSWSRTYRSQALTVAPAPTVRTRYGLDLVIDRRSRDGLDAMLPPVSGVRPAAALERTFAEVAARYGTGTARLVAVQLEHPSGRAAR